MQWWSACTKQLCGNMAVDQMETSLQLATLQAAMGMPGVEESAVVVAKAMDVAKPVLVAALRGVVDQRSALPQQSAVLKLIGVAVACDTQTTVSPAVRAKSNSSTVNICSGHGLQFC